MSVYGVLAVFDSPKKIMAAAKKARDKGFTQFDTYSPFPIHGMDDAMGLKESKLGIIVFIGGACGLLLGFLLQTWVAVSAYPLIISGKPLFSYQAFIPVTFELMVLCSAFSAVFGMFALNRLPQHYHPYLKAKAFERVTTDSFVLGIDASDPQFDQDKVVAFLTDLGGEEIELVES